jgi:hypothetical protein
VDNVHEYNNLFGVCFKWRSFEFIFCLEFFFSMRRFGTFLWWSTFLCYANILFDINFLISIPCQPPPIHHPPHPTPFLLETKRFCWGGSFTLLEFSSLLGRSPCMSEQTDTRFVVVVFSYKTCNYCSIPSRWYHPPHLPPALLDDTLGHDRVGGGSFDVPKYFGTLFFLHTIPHSDHMFGWVAFSAAPWEKKFFF